MCYRINKLDLKNKYSLPETIVRLAETVKKAGGRAVLVGGYVRDLILCELGFPVEPKDPDIEVYRLDPDKLRQILGRFGTINEVGAAFSVFKINGLDVSIPRSDSKVKEGHRGFIIDGNPNMTFAEAAGRRDFTVNAIGLDPLSGEILDEHNGIRDLKQKVLRAVDEKFFGDDPLRVLRAMQFTARFEFKIEAKTAEICRNLNLEELSKERVGEEWKKLLLLSKHPSIGLNVARDLLIIEKLHPELKALIGTPQNPRWHPEGDVWIHTLGVLDQATHIKEKQKLNYEKSLVLMLAALTHDLGKPTTTRGVNGKIVSYGHAKAGVAPAESLMRSFCISESIVARVIPVIREHMFQVFNREISDSSVRKLANRLSPATIEELVWLIEADWYGRGLPDSEFPSVDVLLDKARKLHIDESAPKPLVYGRHLIELGMKPGPEFGPILKQLFDAQLEGKFGTVEEGIKYYQKHIK